MMTNPDEDTRFICPKCKASGKSVKEIIGSRRTERKAACPKCGQAWTQIEYR